MGTGGDTVALGSLSPPLGPAATPQCPGAGTMSTVAHTPVLSPWSQQQPETLSLKDMIFKHSVVLKTHFLSSHLHIKTHFSVLT